jgi:hypothetical protein
MLELDSQAYLVFDDTVLDKSFGPKIEVVRAVERQRKGRDPRHGVGLVRLHKPQNTTLLVIDYRIFDPDRDAKSKLDHVKEMLRSAEHRRLAFRAVLMDSWYATKDLMLLIDGMKKDVLLSAKEQPPGRRFRR